MNNKRGRNLGRRQQELIAILPNIRRFALSLAGNLPDADDLLQSTVERLLERGLPQDAQLLPWTMKVCRNLWIDELRSRKVRRSAAEDPALAAAQTVSGEQQVLGQLTLGEVQAALGRLPEEQRAVLELVAVEGYSYRQAAALLETPIGTVMSRLARARSALAGQVADATAAIDAPGGVRHD
ncbi:MAG TPA: sigma-70 family RNA polymerase sigma factor [Woeseiaceae bacterium]|nr:sigma-70 family RNA polymerase sigma factor [Woeseiaceae bacterium]